MNTDEVDTRTYRVVINHEEQYSIWPSEREIPGGWTDVGKSGMKPECLEYIQKVWTDMDRSAFAAKWKNLALSLREE